MLKIKISFFVTVLSALFLFSVPAWTQHFPEDLERHHVSEQQSQAHTAEHVENTHHDSQESKHFLAQEQSSDEHSEAEREGATGNPPFEDEAEEEGEKLIAELTLTNANFAKELGNGSMPDGTVSKYIKQITSNFENLHIDNLFLTVAAYDFIPFKINGELESEKVVSITLEGKVDVEEESYYLVDVEFEPKYVFKQADEREVYLMTDDLMPVTGKPKEAGALVYTADENGQKLHLISDVITLAKKTNTPWAAKRNINLYFSTGYSDSNPDTLGYIHSIKIYEINP